MAIRRINKEWRDLEETATSEGQWGRRHWAFSPHSEAMHAQMVGMGLLPSLIDDAAAGAAAEEDKDEASAAREQQPAQQLAAAVAVAGSGSGAGAGSGCGEKKALGSATAADKQSPPPPQSSSSASAAVTAGHTTARALGDDRCRHNAAAAAVDTIQTVSDTVFLPFSASPVSPHGDMFRWKAVIIGPPNTAYEGGLFVLNIVFPPDYPFKPMKINFVTTVYHPNIGTTTGHMSLSILGSDWSPALTIGKVLLSIVAVLADPCPESPMCPAIADEYKRDRPTFEATAREWTRRHAMGLG